MSYINYFKKCNKKKNRVTIDYKKEYYVKKNNFSRTHTPALRAASYENKIMSRNILLFIIYSRVKYNEYACICCKNPFSGHEKRGVIFFIFLTFQPMAYLIGNKVEFVPRGLFVLFGS